MSITACIENPYYFGGPVEGSLFFDKEEELRRIFGFLRSGISVSLVGERRSGRTSLLLKIRNAIQSEVCWPDGSPADPAFLCVYLDAQSLRSPEEFYGEVIRKAQEQESTLILPLGNDQSHFASLLRSLSQQRRRLVLLIDEFDTILRNKVFAGEWDLLRSEITAGRVILVTATPKPIDDYFLPGGEASPFFNVFVIERISPFDQESFDAFLTKTAELSGFPVNDCREQVLELGGRWPFFTQMACRLYFDLWSKEGRISAAAHEIVRKQMADQAQPHFEYLWGHLSPKEQAVLEHLANLSVDKQTKVLSVLSVLTQTMIKNLAPQSNPGVEALGAELEKGKVQEDRRERTLAAWKCFGPETRRQLLSFTQPDITVHVLGLKGYILDGKHLFSSVFVDFVLAPHEQAGGETTSGAPTEVKPGHKAHAVITPAEKPAAIGEQEPPSWLNFTFDVLILFAAFSFLATFLAHNWTFFVLTIVLILMVPASLGVGALTMALRRV